MTATPLALDVPSLDQLLMEETVRPWHGLKSAGALPATSPPTPAEVVRVREVAAGIEVTLGGLLDALATLFGPGCVARVRDEVDGLTAMVHVLADHALEALADQRAADLDVRTVRADRDAARDTATRLEGALEAAHDRDRLVRAVLAELVTVAGDPDDTDDTERQQGIGWAAGRLRRALVDPDDPDAPEVLTALDGTPKEF